MKDRETLDYGDLRDAVRITSKIGGELSFLKDPQLGDGYAIEVKSGVLNIELEIYPTSDTLRFSADSEELKLANMSKPRFTDEYVIFQNGDESGKERYVLICNSGELVYISGHTPEVLERIGVPSYKLKPPPYLSEAAVANLPEQSEVVEQAAHLVDSEERGITRLEDQDLSWENRPSDMPHLTWALLRAFKRPRVRTEDGDYI